LTWLQGGGRYRYNVDLNKNSNGDQISLLVNYKNAVNYTFFTYSNGSVKLVNKVENVDTVLAEQKVASVNEENLTLSVDVRDNFVTGFINNKEAVKAPLNIGKMQGGVGLAVWNDANNNAKISVNTIEVCKN
jgi:hypothetical protein